MSRRTHCRRAAEVCALCLVLLTAARANGPRPPLPPPAPSHAERGSEPLAVVVNRSNPVTNLSMSELRTIFLSERSYWPNGRRITPVLRDPGDPEREAILHQVCGMDENQFKTHVLRGMFTGEILVSPKDLSTPAGVRRFIFNVPGAISGLRLSEVDGSVNVVRIDNRLPGDKGYELHVYPSAEGSNE